MSSEEEGPAAWLRKEIAWWLDYAREQAARRPINPMRSHEMQGLIARCEAELAILDEHRGDPSEFGGHRPDGTWQRQGLVCMSCGYDDGHARVAWPCRTVRLLASGYKHRPGFPDALAVS